MPLPTDLLNPVPGTNPSGQNLRYAPVYDKIKEARREEEESPQGEWEHVRKKADYPLVLKLGVEALRTQSKDLQLAVWTSEALLRMEGIAGLTQGLELLRQLLENFWETLYPELEDGDAELRATPLEWVGSRLGQNLQHVPLTRSGLDLFAYKESQAVGYEADAAGSDAKTKQRELAIADGKFTGEQFDEAVAATPKAFYEERVVQADACLAALESLDQICEGKFADYRPSFSNLRESLEEFRDALNQLLKKKRESEPAAQAVVPESAPVVIEAELAMPSTGQTASTVVVSAVRSVSKDPISLDDAIERVALVARYLREQQADRPVAYLLLRALRWGEVRANLGDVDASLLEAPPTEVRKQLRKLLQDGDWQQLLENTEAAMAQPSGRGWLDLQRYLVRASEGLGYAPVSAAIISELKSLLSDYPALPVSMLNDETPAASAETQAWLAELVAPKQPQPVVEELPAPRQKPEPEPGAEELPDAYDLAMQAVHRGRPQEAIAILEREAAQERSGRARFQRKMQLAQICMGAGFEMVALPVLEALAAEIDQRGLEEWEDPDVIIHALGLLYKCLHKLKRSPEQKEQVYARICRLGPAQALELAKSA